MCDQMLGTFCLPSNLSRSDISVLKILRSLQTIGTAKCIDNEREADTESGRGKSTSCFTFCKHCIAQLDSMLAATSISTCLLSAFSEAIPNSNQASTEVYEGLQNSNCYVSSFGSGSISSQECTESRNKLLMFLKLVSAAYISNSLSETKVDSTTSDASLLQCDVSTATSPIEIAHHSVSVTQQIEGDTICDANSTYFSDDTDHKIEGGVYIEDCIPLPPANATSSQQEALLDYEDYNAYDNTTTYTLEDLFPEPEERSYIFPDYKNETVNATATAPAADTVAVIGQPSSILTMEQPGLGNQHATDDEKVPNDLSKFRVVL